MSCIKTFNSSECLFDSQKTKKFTHKSKAYAGSAGPKVNANAMLHAAKRDDYERVKILYRCLVSFPEFMSRSRFYTTTSAGTGTGLSGWRR